MQPVNLQQNPVFHPHVCIRCGCGTGQREFFVDLGVTLLGYFNPMYDGAIYYCDRCVRNLVVDINRLVIQWDEEHSPWESPDRVEASYTYQDKIDLSDVEAEIERNRASAAGNNPVPEFQYPESESNNRASQESASVSSLSVPTVSTDEPKLELGFGDPT